jgi:hypothetical protein
VADLSALQKDLLIALDRTRVAEQGLEATETEESSDASILICR